MFCVVCAGNWNLLWNVQMENKNWWRETPMTRQICKMLIIGYVSICCKILGGKSWGIAKAGSCRHLSRDHQQPLLPDLISMACSTCFL